MGVMLLAKSSYEPSPKDHNAASDIGVTNCCDTLLLIPLVARNAFSGH